MLLKLCFILQIAGFRNKLLYTMPAGMACPGDSYQQIRIPKEQVIFQ